MDEQKLLPVLKNGQNGNNKIMEKQIKQQQYEDVYTPDLDISDIADIDKDQYSLENQKIYKEYVMKNHIAKTKELYSLDNIPNIKEEDKPFLIINKDTGDVIDARNEELVTNLTKSVQLNYLDEINMTKTVWNDFWVNMKKVHNEFIDAAELGDMEKIKFIFEKDALIYPINPNFKVLDDWTALHFVANENHVKIAQYIIEKGSNIEAETLFKRRPLHMAALRGNYELVELFLKKGANVSCQDQDFYSPLHYAAENGFTQIVDALLKYKANVEIKNIYGLTPLESSLNEQILQIFQQYGHKKTYKNSYNRVRKDYVEKMLFNKNRKPQISQVSTVVDQEEEVKKVENNKQNTISKIKITSKKIGFEDFEFYQSLGRGAFGEVFLVKLKNQQDNRYHAMKMLKKEKIKSNNLLRYCKIEKDVMSIMNHPFIVNLNYAFQTETRLFLVMQFYPGGDLSKYLDRVDVLQENVAKIYIAEIILGLEALHKNNIIFRDLKPSNVLIDENGHIALCDFGLANLEINKDGEESMRKSFCGTPAYLAPEMIRRIGHNRMVDWYHLGVILYELLIGITPYYAPNKDQLYKNILEGPLKMPQHGISLEAKDLILKLLHRNPKKRLGIQRDSQEIKDHEWFKNINWDDVYNKKLSPPKPEKYPYPQIPLDVQLLRTKQEICKVDDWTMFDKDYQNGNDKNQN